MVIFITGNVFRHGEFKLVQENFVFWRKIKQLPVIHPVVVAGRMHFVNKCMLNETCDVEWSFFKVVFEIA